MKIAFNRGIEQRILCDVIAYFQRPFSLNRLTSWKCRIAAWKLHKNRPKKPFFDMRPFWFALHTNFMTQSILLPSRNRTWTLATSISTTSSANLTWSTRRSWSRWRKWRREYAETPRPCLPVKRYFFLYFITFTMGRTNAQMERWNRVKDRFTKS